MSVRQFAFIRAINTGGRRLTNEQVLAPFLQAGLDDVHAYQAAGNVAFRSDRDPRDLEVELAQLLAEDYGFDAPTFVRVATELRATIDGIVFPDEAVAASQGKVQVTFLSQVPAPDRIAEAQALVTDHDHVVFAGREWFWLPRAGISDSMLPVGRMERILGPMTMRTVGTVERMLARFSDR
jgi:uncharacterized protein (DUF1697 family)